MEYPCRVILARYRASPVALFDLEITLDKSLEYDVVFSTTKERFMYFTVATVVFVGYMLWKIIGRKASAATLFWAFFQAAIAAAITVVAVGFVFDLVVNFLIKD